MYSDFKCADGWSLSVKDDNGKASAGTKGESVECSFPSSTPLTREFCSYAEDDYDLTDTHYCYVPYEVLWNELAHHGGVADDSPYKPYFLMKWAYEREADRLLEVLAKLSKEQSRVHALQAMVKPAIKNPTP